MWLVLPIVVVVLLVVICLVVLVMFFVFICTSFASGQCVFVCFALSHLESVFDLSLDESHGGVSVPSCEGHPCHVDDDSGKRQAPDILDIEAEACPDKHHHGEKCQ